jgi:hypothetical protein
MPGLARLALQPMPRGWDWYGYIILFELRRDGPRNDRWQWCSPRQRGAVAGLLEHLYETRRDEIRVYDCEHELLEALEVWLEKEEEAGAEPP